MEFLLTLALLASVTGTVSGVSQQVITKTLHDFLFTDYDSNLIPHCETGSNVTVNLDMALRQIVDVNEREQVMTMNVWMRMRWNDCRFSWDPTSYNNITALTVGFTDVWVPDITLYDSAAEEVMFPGMELYVATISSSGIVTYNFPTVVKSVCRVNVRFFPFDTQRCAMQFGSWSFHGLALDLVNRNPQGSDIGSFNQNSEWDVLEMPVERHVLYYGCCVEPYPDVTFYIVMQRRSAFYVLTMIFPCILTSIVAAFAFLLPVESGEKVSLEITVLLSLAVFLLLVSESLPPSSDNFPILGEYFASAMALVSLSLLQTVIVLNVAYRGSNRRRVPRLMKVIFFNYLGRFLCTKSNKVVHKETENKEDKPSFTSGNFTVPTSIQLSESKTEDETSDDIPEVKANGGTGKDWQRKLRNGGTIPDRLPMLNLHDPMYYLVKEQTEYLRKMDYVVTERKIESEINAEWKDLSDILDRLFFILYILVTTVTTLGHLLQAV